MSAAVMESLGILTTTARLLPNDMPELNITESNISLFFACCLSSAWSRSNAGVFARDRYSMSWSYSSICMELYED